MVKIAKKEYNDCMIDETVLAQINGAYVCPPDAGPAWRAAYEAGIDVSLIEENLRLTPEERLERHQHALDMILEMREAGKKHAAK